MGDSNSQAAKAAADSQSAAFTDFANPPSNPGPLAPPAKCSSGRGLFLCLHRSKQKAPEQGAALRLLPFWGYYSAYQFGPISWFLYS